MGDKHATQLASQVPVILYTASKIFQSAAHAWADLFYAALRHNNGSISRAVAETNKKASTTLQMLPLRCNDSIMVLLSKVIHCQVTVSIKIKEEVSKVGTTCERVLNMVC